MRALLLTLTTCLLVLPAQAKYSGGTGEPNDPYQIATAADLIALGETPEDYDKHFILTADIDLDPNLPGGKVFDKAVIAPDNDPTKWGLQGVAFIGVFDGNSHTISHLAIMGAYYVGLFGQLGDWPPAGQSEVRNLEVADVNIVGSGDCIGGLVGLNLSGNVTHCYAMGAVSGRYQVGGLVGDNHSGQVTQCYSTCVVGGLASVGGLMGDNSGIVTQCYSTGAVSGTQFEIGGLVGHNGGPLTHCYSTAMVSGTGRQIGGLVGTGHSVMASFWDIQTSGQATSDGGTGQTTVEMKTTRTFLSWGACGNEGTWTIDEGNDYPRLAWEHKPGKVLAARLSDLLGGSGSEDDPYLIYTPSDIETISYFSCERDKHFRLAFLAGAGTEDDPYLVYTVEEINLLNMCPYEQDAHFRLMFVEGKGTQESPYLLSTAGQLNMIGVLPKEWDKHFKLVADIDLSGFDGKDGRPGFNIIGASVRDCFVQGGPCWFAGTPFTGVFDGNGHTISRLTVDTQYHVGGLFSGLGSGGQVKNLGVVDVNITSAGGFIGGLMGFNGGAVTGCYSTGVVCGKENVGGLVGWNEGSVTCCYSTGAVKGTANVGGLIGTNGGHVTDCYSTGTVSGQTSVGGLAGCGSVPTSVRGGSVLYIPGIVTKCFWDTQTSGQTASAGGTGKTTAEMQTAATFLEAGWDFVDETANGTEDIWWILEGKDYPRLWWEAQN